MNPYVIVSRVVRAQDTQAVIERATYLRALDDLAEKADGQFRAAQAAHHFMATQHWQEVRRWIAEQRRIAAREGEVQG